MDNNKQNTSKEKLNIKRKIIQSSIRNALEEIRILEMEEIKRNFY